MCDPSESRLDRPGPMALPANRRRNAAIPPQVWAERQELVSGAKQQGN
jgi:hypothetical protein